MVSDWSSWSSCSTTSGLGNQERTRRVIEEPNLKGIACPELTETRWCQPGHQSNIKKIKNTQKYSGAIVTGGQNYETGYLDTVESYPPTCSIPNLPTGFSSFLFFCMTSSQRGTGTLLLFFPLHLPHLLSVVASKQDGSQTLTIV